MRRGLMGLVMVSVMGVTLFGATAARAGQIVNWTGNGFESVVKCQRGGTM